MLDPDRLLELVRDRLAAAVKACPSVSAVTGAAEAFGKLDAQLRAGGDLPEDWIGDDDDDEPGTGTDDDSGDGGDAGDAGDDELEDDEPEDDELARVLRGAAGEE